MSYLPANVMGRWFHLYLILDIYSRKIVGAEVHDSDDSGHAVHLVRRTALAEGIATMATKPVLHGDNGSTLNVHWYNVDHRHSGIRYVSPAQRHAGNDREILAARHDVYLQARERHPARWSGRTRNWTPIGAVTLNPERDSVVTMASQLTDIQPLAA